MAYNTPPTKSTGDVFTAAEFNTYIRDNFAAGAPDVFTTKGDLIVATGADAAARLAAGSAGQKLVADSGEATGLKWVTERVLIRATNTSWDGDAKNIGTHTINLVSAFGLPSGIKSVFVWVAVKWAASSDGNTLRIGPNGATYEFVYIRGNRGAGALCDDTAEVLLINDSIDVQVAGANATEVYITVQGYTY